MAQVVAHAIKTIGQEYGAQIEYIDPAVIAVILDQTSCHDFGARPYEYAADRLLGGVLGEAAAQHARAPLRIISGDPPRCLPSDTDDRLLPQGIQEEDLS